MGVGHLHLPTSSYLAIQQYYWTKYDLQLFPALCGVVKARLPVVKFCFQVILEKGIFSVIGVLYGVANHK